MLTETASTIIGAGTFEVLFMDQCWWDRYSITVRERYADLESAIALCLATPVRSRNHRRAAHL